jgi:hypothetical protein
MHRVILSRTRSAVTRDCDLPLANRALHALLNQISRARDVKGVSAKQLQLRRRLR